MAAFAPMTEINKEDMALDQVSCIHYPVWFKKDKIKALINSGSKVNAMSLRYALKLGLKVRYTNVKTQKINGSTFKTFGMVLASFQVENKFGKTHFFQETFLSADMGIKIMLKMPF